MKKLGVPAISAGLASACVLLACSPATPPVAADDIRIAKLEPLASGANRDTGEVRPIKSKQADYVSEQVAQSLLEQLKQWPQTGVELASALHYCSGRVASTQLGGKSACQEADGPEAEAACFQQHGYGKQSVGQALTADRRDLNGDGVKDYIISDRYYCQSLTANQSAVYFVMLSAPKGGFKLSYASWASYGLSVVDDKVNRKPVLLEQAEKQYGKYMRILDLVDSRYVLKSCLFQDEHGYSACPPQ